TDAVGAGISEAVDDAVGATMVSALRGTPYRYFQPPSEQIAFGSTSHKSQDSNNDNNNGNNGDNNGNGNGNGNNPPPTVGPTNPPPRTFPTPILPTPGPPTRSPRP